MTNPEINLEWLAQRSIVQSQLREKALEELAQSDQPKSTSENTEQVEGEQ